MDVGSNPATGSRNVMHELVLSGNPILNKVALPVTEGEDVSEILNSMWMIMITNNGIGLAGNQIGLLKRIIIISHKGTDIECINPILIKKYGGKKTAPEGCLSFPKEEYEKTRFRKVILVGYDRNWDRIRLKLSGILAVCAQHELDHLNGITIK